MGIFMISVINRIANGIDSLIEEGVIAKNKDVVLFGLNRYSFAMRTILSHRSIEVYAFLSDDEEAIVKTRRSVKDFACRYLRSERDAIELFILGKDEISDKKMPVILLAEERYEEKKEKLIKAGYIENKDFFKVYSFYEKDIDGIISNKKRLDLNQIKAYEREMLKLVDQICLNNNLRYWVCGGTMLGTVRHQGFIPWDDDIDIFLPLDDYMRFMEVFPKSNRYKIKGYGPNGADGFYYIFAKLLDRKTLLDDDMIIVRELASIFIDIFPLVGLPENKEDRDRFFIDYQELEKSIIQEFYASDGELKVFEKRFSEQEVFLRKYSFDKAKFVGVLGTRYGNKDCTTRDVYKGTLRMKFDDIEVNVPVGYGEYLSNLYGDDYMNIPPISKRKSFHTLKAYRAD